MKKNLIFAIFFVLALGQNFLSAVQPSNENVRNYSASLKDEGEVKDIHFIITTMGKATNRVQLLPKAGQLKAAGDRIINVHPLQYLKVVFTSEEMKVGISNMRKFDFVWKKFLDGDGSRKGIRQTLEEEYAKDNVTEDQLKDLASAIHIDPKLVGQVQNAFRNQQWEQFIDLLIKYVPRQGNTRKYDM